MRDGEQSEDIILKRSGRRARLEVTLDEEPAGAVAGVVRRPRSDPATQAPGSGTAPVPVATPTVVEPSGGRRPPGGPPVIYVHDEPGGAWWQTRSASVAAVVVLLVALVVAASVLLLGGKDDKQPVATELANTHNAMQAAIGQTGRATKLVQIRSAGRSAYRQLARLDSPAANVSHQDDKDVARPAAQLIAAERSYLSALSHLGEVKFAVAADPRLTHWKSIRTRIADAQAPLMLASAKVDRLGLPTSAGTLLVTQAQLDRTLDHVDATVTAANHQVLLYERRLKAYRSSKRRAVSKASPVVQYRDRVGQILASYAAGRHDVDVWVVGITDVHPDNADEAQAKVEGFIAAREDVINQLSSALDSAPPSVRSEHKALGVPLSDSLEGLNAAASAIGETQYSDDPEADPTQSTSWIRFQDASDRAQATLASARASWGQAVALAIQRLRSSGIAAHPKRPQV